MKKFIVLLLLILTGFSLFAQTYREGRIFIQPVIETTVTGTGQTGANSYFFQRLTYETVLQYHTLAANPNDADYILKGTLGPFTGIENIFEIIAPVNGIEPVSADSAVSPVMPSATPVPEHANPPVQNTEGRREFFSWETDNEYILFYGSAGDSNYEQPPPVVEIVNPQDVQEYIFTLELIDNLTGEVIGRQYIIYDTIDASINDYLSVIIFNMLAGIPRFEIPDDLREQWLFFDLSVLWLSHIYLNQSLPNDFLNFGFRLSADFHFTDFLAIGLGVQIARESINGKTGITATLPVALKYIYKPGDSLMIEPYTGISFNYSIRSDSSPYSWFAGCQIGIAAEDYGFFTIDPRFSVDFTKSTLGDTRVVFEVGIGYKFGYFPKRSSAD